MICDFETARASRSRSTDRYHDARSTKILALEKRRDIMGLGQCIGCAITGVQPSGMAAFAEPQKRRPCQASQNPVMSDNLDAQPINQRVEWFPRGLVAKPPRMV